MRIIMLKTIVIGAGGIAAQHCEAMKKLGVKIVGIYDVDAERARKLALRYDSKAVENLEEEMAQADMVHILTPPSIRTTYVEMAARMGKHIMMEKPAAVTLEDARAMEACIKKYGVQCMMAFTQRFRKGYRIVKELMDAGKIGDVVQVFCLRVGPGPGFSGTLQDSWRTDRKFVCGMAIESLSHDIDFLQSLAGDIVQVSGKVKGTVAALPEFDNNVDAVLTFADGAVGTLTASWSSHIPYNIKGVIGTKGSVFLQGDDIWDSTKVITRLSDGDTTVENLHDIYQEGEGYLEENRVFVECIETGNAVPCDLSVGRKVLEISRKILETSAKERYVSRMP